MNDSEQLKFNIKIKYHILFWAIYFLLNFLRWGAYYDDYAYSFQSNMIEYSLHIIFVYFNLFVLLPKLILKSKYTSYILVIIACLFVIYIVKTELILFLIDKKIWPEANSKLKPYGINHIISECVGQVYVLTLVSSVYLTLNWIRERERNRALTEEKIKIKLKNLENQIRPHFFFNTLNNLYALSISNSSMLPNTIIKLSDLMKFLLYDVKENNFVSLSKELQYTQNYIDIEKLRFKNIDVKTNINSDIEHIMVPPMIFITFIENAFKHGGHDGVLKIKINCGTDDNNQYFTFEVINNFIPQKILSSTKGIGIENIINRLKLLYKDDFELIQTHKLNFFIIKLKIPANYED